MVFHRPQHLLSRFSSHFRVFYIETPIFGANSDRFDITLTPEQVVIVALHLEGEESALDVAPRQEALLSKLIHDENIEAFIFWYNNPLALTFTRPFAPHLIIYDCMNSSSAHSIPSSTEKELTLTADLVFTDGIHLADEKKKFNIGTYNFPSSVEAGDFTRSNLSIIPPADQEAIRMPRIGFNGMIDERLDLTLLSDVARQNPSWQFVLTGPIEMDPTKLPDLSNIYFLGSKRYYELPSYFFGWDVVFLPYLQESISSINPTNVLEFFTSEVPVVATPTNQVISDLGNSGLLSLATSAEEASQKIGNQLSIHSSEKNEWLNDVHNMLSHTSWDRTCTEMLLLLRTKLVEKQLAGLEDLDSIQNHSLYHASTL